MATTFTIKQVPDCVADALRERAARNRRSLQRELLLLIEEAAQARAPHAAEPARAYAVPAAALGTADKTTRTRKRGGASAAPRSGRLTLEQLWQRARALGASSPGESAAIVRRDRDARHGR